MKIFPISIHLFNFNVSRNQLLALALAAVVCGIGIEFFRAYIYNFKVKSELLLLCKISEPYLQIGEIRTAHDTLIGITNSASIPALPIIAKNGKNLIEPHSMFTVEYLCKLDGINNLKLKFLYKQYEFNMLELILIIFVINLLFILIYILISRRYETKRLQQMEAELIVVKIELAHQVAHDIRSPLSVLNLINSKTNLTSDETRLLIFQATSRINEIANDLLSNYNLNLASKAQKSGVNLNETVKAIYNEKKLIWSNFAVDFQLVIQCSDYSCAICDLVTLRRVLSNLLNNAYESLNGGKGEISISLLEASEYLIIHIVDTGKGMDIKELQLLGTKGFTNKNADSSNSGSGLGFFHALNSVKKWGGIININSKVDQGTLVEIKLKKEV